MASLESFGVDEYGNSNGVNLPDFTGCLLLATTPTPPAGTLVADGSEVSRASYPELFAKIGTTYGEGDGVTTFALPDWRDEFPRFSGTERTVGTKQGDAIREISGYFTVRGWRGGPTSEAGSVAIGPNTPPFTLKSGSLLSSPCGSDAGASDIPNTNVSFAASRVVPTADENRPRNVAFLPCIIYV